MWWHRHYWGHGFVPVQNSKGEFEMVPSRYCWDQNCKRFQVWVKPRWFDYPPNFRMEGYYFHAQYI